MLPTTHIRWFAILTFIFTIQFAFVSATSADANTHTLVLSPTEYADYSWLTSPILSECTGPTDEHGRQWYDPAYDDLTWTISDLARDSNIPELSDRFFRLDYQVDTVVPTSIHINSDDGMWLYVNGTLVENLGSGCHEGGIVEDATLDITPYLHPGVNVIAIHLTNGLQGSLLQVEIPQRFETWKSSPVSTNCDGPQDSEGLLWFDPAFNDSNWSPVKLPVTGPFTEANDQFYRLEYVVDKVEPTTIRLSSDDGLWLYINGEFVGHWGADCHGNGTVQDYWLTITDFLQPGRNVIAAHVSNGYQAYAFDARLSSSITLPANGKVTIDYRGFVTLSCQGNFGLATPDDILIYPNYLTEAGISFPLTNYYTEGTELVFYIKPRDFCGDDTTTYYSNDLQRAFVERVDTNTWRIFWEDYNDADFNDLIIDVNFYEHTAPFMELPYDYTGSSFADESLDTEQGGKLNSYFDHRYPTYCMLPNRGCSSTDRSAVNFHGYDGSTNSGTQPPYKLAYNGHDGIDYAVGGENMLAVASGTVTRVYTDAVKGKVVEVEHENGYISAYYHMQTISVTTGTLVTRTSISDTRAILGTIGGTGSGAGGNVHVHLTLINPDGVVIDPYGWNPQPGALWDHRRDPWQVYNSTLQVPHEARSDYLWIYPLNDIKIFDPALSESVTIGSSSGDIEATFTPVSHNVALRVEYVPLPRSPNIAGYTGIRTFSVSAFDSTDNALQRLNGNMTVTLDTSLLPSSDMLDKSVFLLVWNPTTYDWDPVSLSITPEKVTATTDRVGLFAFVSPSPLYLPVIQR